MSEQDCINRPACVCFFMSFARKVLRRLSICGKLAETYV